MNDSMIKTSKIKLLPIKTGNDYAVAFQINNIDITDINFKAQIINTKVVGRPVLAEFTVIKDIVVQKVFLELERSVTKTLPIGEWEGDILFLTGTEPNVKAMAHIDFTAPVIQGLTQYE